MIQLASGQTFSGKAGTATAITYTINKDLITTGDDFTPVQGQLASSTATLFTSTGGQTIIRSIQLTNTTASPVTGVVLYLAGTAAANQLVTMTIAANGSATYESGQGWLTYDASGNILGGSGYVDLTTNQTVAGVKTFSSPPVLSTGEKFTGLAGSGVAYNQGLLFYDTDSESLTFMNNDSTPTLQIGQEEWVRVKNVTGSTIANGAAVYINGADAGSGLPTIALAKGDAATTIIGAGLATESIANNAIGYVTTMGVVHGLDTSGFSAGATIFISAVTAGTLTSTAPVSPNYRYRLGIVVVSSATVGSIHVTPSTAALGNGSANQLFGMNTAGTAQEVKSLTADTGNSVVVTNGTNTIKLSRPALTGDVTASADSNATTLAAGSASNLNSGTLLAARMPALTGDITTSAGAVATTLATVNTVTPGTFGSATATPVITVNGKGLTTASAQTNILIAESQVTNLTTDLGNKQPLDSDLTTIAALTPTAGQVMEYGASGWAGVTSEYDVTSFGADPTAGGDSTVGFYNAIISCLIQPGLASRATVSSQTTTGTTFTLPVAANTLPSTGTLHAQTTTGLIGFTYTGGGTTSLSCTTTYGMTGGLILNTSIVGSNNSIVNGGIVNIPAGFYITSYPIINSIPGIWFKGAGGSTTHDTGAWPSGGGSFISQRGATQGLDVLVNMPISGNSGIQGGQVLGGIRVTGLNADCTNANGYMWCRSGFVMLSTSGEYMEDLFVYNASLTAYRFSTLGASMLSEAADQTRGTHINLRFRQLEGKSTAANISASGLTNPAATTNLNALSASTVTVSGAPNANWDTSGLAKFQAIDQLTGNVCWYLVAYTGISGSTLTGCTAIAQLPNETNSTTLNAATPASGNFKPNALMFANSRIVPAQGAFGDGITWHGSATANACCGTWMNLVGTYWMGTALYSANSDSQKVINPVFNRTSAGSPTGIGVELHGSTLAGASGASGSTRNQYFIGGDPGLGGITVRGTDTLGYLQPAATNKWDYYELGNGAPIPVSGTNAHFIWTANGGLAVGSQAVSLAAQATAASFTGFITGTTVVVPPQGIQVGTTFRWIIPIIKTLAGTTYTVQVRWGTTNTFASDTVAIASQALTGTAVVDTGQIEITMTVVGPLGATAAALAQIRLTHNLAITGLSTTGTAGSLQAAMTMATFASTLTNPGPAFLNVAISANAANVFTFNAPVTAEVIRAANP